jgi:hypothetical protein
VSSIGSYLDTIKINVKHFFLGASDIRFTTIEHYLSYGTTCITKHHSDYGTMTKHYFDYGTMSITKHSFDNGPMTIYYFDYLGKTDVSGTYTKIKVLHPVREL